jgi:glycine/D-amino acid oxidase-like deaminating enzyme
LTVIAEKVLSFMPGLGDLPVRRFWAGLRTFASDSGLVIGQDPRIRGFYWCAGLGGHGVAASAAVGRIAAETVLDRPGPLAFSPARFFKCPPTT